MWTVDLGRAAVLGLLAAAILAGWASIPLLAAGAFLLGVGQTLFDSAAQASIPTIVGRESERLAAANGRMLGAQTAGAALALIGLSTTIGNVIVQSLRQARTPQRLLGRVVSAFRLVGLGVIPVAAVLGGLLGRIYLRLPYFAGTGVLLLAFLAAARLLRGDAIGRARAALDTEDAAPAAKSG